VLIDRRIVQFDDRPPTPLESVVILDEKAALSALDI
jgi:hypothetical protein